MPYPLIILTDDNDNPIVEFNLASSNTNLAPVLKFYTDNTGSNSTTITASSSLTFEKWYFIEARVTGSSIGIKIDGNGTTQTVTISSATFTHLTNYVLGDGTNTLIYPTKGRMGSDGTNYMRG